MKKLISLFMTVIMACSVFVAFDVTASAATKTANLKSLTNTAKAITIKWAKTSGATKYIVQKKASGQKAYKNVKTTGKSTYSYNDKSVKAGTTYSYKIIAVQGTNQYVSKAKNVTRLLAPTGVTVKASEESSVVVKWKKSKGAKKYQVYRKTTGKYKKIDTTSHNAYYDYDAKSGAVNSYKVVAVNGSSKSVYSSAKSITYIEAPQPFMGVAAKDGIKLNWEKSKNAQGYKIYKGTGLKSYILLKNASANTTSYTDTDVEEGKTYKYYIVAYKGKAVSEQAKTSVTYDAMLKIDVKVGESSTKFKDYLEISKELMGDAAIFMDYITFSYVSGNPEIATVDKDGTVNGVSAGTTKIAVFATTKIPGFGTMKEESGYFLVNVTE